MLKTLGDRHSKRIDTMVRDFVSTSMESDLVRLGMSVEVLDAVETLRAFLYERVYEGQETKSEFTKARKILMDLYDYYLKHPEDVFRDIPPVKGEDSRRRVCDFIAGMTDRFAILTFERLFMPLQWDII